MGGSRTTRAVVLVNQAASKDATMTVCIESTLSQIIGIVLTLLLFSSRRPAGHRYSGIQFKEQCYCADNAHTSTGKLSVPIRVPTVAETCVATSYSHTMCTTDCIKSAWRVRSVEVFLRYAHSSPKCVESMLAVEGITIALYSH